MMTKKNVTTSIGWLVLTLLMLGMSWSAAVAPATDVASGAEEVDIVDESEDVLALPENDVTVGLDEFDPAKELLGSRTENSKTYIGEDGERLAVVGAGAMHYLEDGSWEEIDLNIDSTAAGWEVTKNSFETQFSSNMQDGVTVQFDQNIDPIRFGLNPMPAWFIGEGFSPMPYIEEPATEGVTVGANVIRYPVNTNAEIDYVVTSEGIKQNLNIRDMPFAPEGFEGYFGLQETMIIPSGHALFIGDSMIEDGGKLTTTNTSIDVRNIETGELLVVIDRPLIYDQSNLDGDSPDGHLGLYVVRSFGEVIEIATVVDTDWLLSEERVYPVQIDPTISQGSQRSGYSYYYRTTGWWSSTYERSYSTNSLFSVGTCRGYRSVQSCTTSSGYSFYYRYAWYRFDFNNAVPTGATVQDADFYVHMGRYRSGSAQMVMSVLKSGSSQSSNHIDPSSYLYSSGIYLNRYIRNSAASSTTTTLSDPGYYWSGMQSRTLDFNTNGESDIQDAIDGNAAGSNGHVIGLGLRNGNSNEPFWYMCGTSTYSYCNSASELPKITISYTGGSDTSPPTADFAPYTGLTSYREDARTFYIGLTDSSGVDTTSAQGPRLHYRVNNGSYTAISATSIGTCLAGQQCNFKAQIPAVNLGDYVQYFWAYRDLSTTGPNQGPNTGTTPSGGTGTPASITPPSTPYNYFVQDVEDAPHDQRKTQIAVNEQSNYFYYQARNFFTYQVTMWENNREYMIELDTSNCGTGSSSCFKTSGLQWNAKYMGSRYTTYTTSTSVTAKVASVPGLTFAADDGPGMNLMYYWDTTTSSLGVLGLGTQTGIDELVSGGLTQTTLASGNTDDGYVRVTIPTDYTGYFGDLPLNGSSSGTSTPGTGYWSSTSRNMACVGSNGYFYLVRGNPAYCTTWFSTSYKFNGFNVGVTDTRFNAAGGPNIVSKASNIRPTPDTFPPVIDHAGLMDSYTEDGRTIKFLLSDAGDPPTGMNITAGQDANGDLYRPFIRYQVMDSVNGSTTWSSETVVPMTPAGGFTSCEMAECDWSAVIPGTTRGNSVQYTIHARDNNGNMVNTSSFSYDLVTPTKVMTIEWHNQNCGFGSQYQCSWQVKLYDVSNEIEFLYDTSSQMYYDYEKVGYQSPNGAVGDDILGRGSGYQSGYTPSRWTDNYRIATDGNNHGYEAFQVGMTELFNYDLEMEGSSNGRPYTYYCTRYWSSYRNQCSTVIDLPAGFDFEYFGTTYSGNSSHKIHAIRHGAMQFSTSSSSNSAQMMYYGWGTTMPAMPSTGSYVRNVDLAPWWGYYASYYCYGGSSNQDCSIRSKVIPFDGAGSDVSADINQDTIWDLEMSPIRVNPANGDYVTVNADLTIESGVEIQIAEGKGILFNGACNKLMVNGTEDLPVNFTDLGTTSANALGLAFTNGCTATSGTHTTDDRHQFTFTNFENMTVAISAGSAHGNAPRYNGNVGDFSMENMTFTNVGKAISHGSGQGTSFTMTGFSISQAADACMDLPEDSIVELRWGTMDECNTNWNDWGGAIVNYPGSSGGSLTMENVTITDARSNGISVDFDDLWLSNVSITIPDLTSDAGRPGTNWNPDGAVYHDPTSASGSSFYAHNLDLEGYYRAVYTQATDSITMDDIVGTDMEGFISVIPAGSNTVMGPTGDDAVFQDIDVTGTSNSQSQLYLERTRPTSIDNVAFTTTGTAPGLHFVGSSPDSGKVFVNNYDGAHIGVYGCGWNIDARVVAIDTDNTGVVSNCGSSSSSNMVTISEGDLDYSGSTHGAAFAQNTILTIAVSNIDSNFVNIGQSHTGGSVRLIDITYGNDDCVTAANGYEGQSTCPTYVSHPGGELFVGETATVGVYRTINGANTYVADHAVTTTVVTSSGTCPDVNSAGLCTVNEVAVVGTVKTAGGANNGLAEAWLITDRLEYSSSGTVVSDSYTEHSFSIGGGAGQNITTPADVWYTAAYNPPLNHDLPLEVGERADFMLEAYPQDWNGATKDCNFLNVDDGSGSGNTSSYIGANGESYALYTLQIITLSTNLVLDNCNLHLNGTKFSVNSSATNSPTITLRNGAKLLLTGGIASGGVDGYIRGTSSLYGWTMNIENGEFNMDHSFIRDMKQDSTSMSGLLIGEGATMSMENESYALGSYASNADMATIKVNGGTLIVDDARISNNQNTGVGLHIENSASTDIDDITVENAGTGIMVKSAAPSIDDFTLANNDVGMENYGGMSLPTIYRSPLLQGQSGWVTHEIDITRFANDDDVVQMAFNSVFAGGNAHYYAYSTSYYYMIYDRMRIYVDDGTGSDLDNDGSDEDLITYGHPMTLNTDSDATYGEPPHWDCNAYGYKYNPGGSYQYAYYYYMLNYGPSQLASNGSWSGSNAGSPLNFGFRMESADGLTQNTNYYPYHFWGGYWPSFYPNSPDSSRGMWGSYGSCMDYAYRYGTPNPAGWRIEFPPVSTPATNYDSVTLKIDVFHNRNNYFEDRFDFLYRGGTDHTQMGQWAREFGVAQINNGQITGSDTGILVSGGRAAGSISDVTVTAPTNEGILIDGSNAMNFDDVNVTQGSYGVRLTTSGAGSTTMTNMELYDQSQTGMVLAGSTGLTFGGEIVQSATSGISVLSSSSVDWSFDNLMVRDSAIGMNHAGTGDVRMVDSTFQDNTDDMTIGAGTVTYVEGTIADQAVTQTVNVNGGGEFSRNRLYDVGLLVDNIDPASGVNLKLLDSDMRLVATATTDSVGAALDMEFTAYTVDYSGHQAKNLAGMTLAGVHDYEYTSTSRDFRYIMETVTLADVPTNADTINMVDSVDIHVCYRYTSSSYDNMRSCSNVGSGSSDTVGSLTQYDAYYGLKEDDGNDKVILMDHAYNYLDSANEAFLNNSIIFVTGGYNGVGDIRIEYPYTQTINMDNTTIVSVGPDNGDRSHAFRLGYSGTSNYAGFNINNTDLIGIATMASGRGYYGAPSEFIVTNSTFSHYRVPPSGSSVEYNDVCVATAGIADARIEDNTFYDCQAGVMIPYNYYAYSTYYSGTGTDDMIVEGNTFVDTTSLGFWAYLNTKADDILIKDNTYTGSTIPTYGVYIQDATTNSIDIVDNDILAENPIYSRSGKQWDIDGNTIRGISSASNAGIYVQSGHGTITDNNLIDADGGIAVYGVRGNNDVDIMDNTVSFTSGRTPTSAVGIVVDNCGTTSTINMGGNDVSTISNALVTDGCTVVDEGSSFTSLGGAAARVHTVEIRASVFSPQNITVSVGDTVRWHAVQYNSDPNNYQHSTTENTTGSPVWDSGLLNNGSYFAHTFTTTGVYEYHCSAHPDMYGTVTVTTSSGPALASIGVNVAGSDDYLSFSNTSISGFGTGIQMEGGDLYLGGTSQARSGNGVLIVADGYGVDAEDVDITMNGATIDVDDTNGIAVSSVSSSGLHDLDLTDLSTSGDVGLLTDKHKDFRWNGGTSTSDTTLKTINTASGSIENMTWSGTNVQIDAGAFSTVTSVGNGVLDSSKLAVSSSAIVHEANLLNLDVTHMGQAASDVALTIRSTEDYNTLTGGTVPLVAHSRAEYVSPSWRTRAGSVIQTDGDLADWFGDYTAESNIADDMMPGSVAKNLTSGGEMRITWDATNVYIGIVGVTFTASDGMIYLDTVPGGSSTGDNWYVTHNLPFQADFMLFAEDATSWGIKRVTPTGNWVDVTSSCNGISSFVGFGYPGVTSTFNLNSEFAIPWACIGSPTDDVRWLTVVQNENTGHVLAAFPPQVWDQANATAQNFYDFGGFDLTGTDLADGTLDDFLLIFRTYAGTTTPTPARPYDIIVKVRDVDNDYWDWGERNGVMMSQNQNVEIDILRAKPVIQNLIDVTVDEDTGMTTLSMTELATDFQTEDVNLTWEIVDSAANTHTYMTPYSYGLNGQSFEVTTLADQFGGHRLKATVTDADGLNSTQTFFWNVTNVNDKPIICNSLNDYGANDCGLVLTDDGQGGINIRDEAAIDGANGFTVPKSLGSVYNQSGSFVIDMANENSQSDNNPHAVPQIYNWTAAADGCIPFDISMAGTTSILIAENATNEAGGSCDILFGLTDGVDDADDMTVQFIVNPINDAPVIYGPDLQAEKYVEVANGDKLTAGDAEDWYIELTEDDTNVDNLTFDMSRMMFDIDHQQADYQWEVAKTANCDYDHYFTIALDQDTEEMQITLIPDATTTAPTSEIDFLQDADGDGVRDGGIHQMVPASGYYCTVNLYLNDTADAPDYINYSQAGYDTYDQRSDRVTLHIRVNNVVEARPDYQFNTNFGFDYLNIEAVMPGTRVPFTVEVTNTGDDPSLYNYPHDVQIRFTANDNPNAIQHQVTLEWDDGEVPGVGDTVLVTGYITMNSATDEIAAFAEVRTTDPFTEDYVTDNFRRPALEELNWDNNNMTSTDVGTILPKMVGLKAASSVSSFLPGLLSVSLVGLFLGLNLISARREEDEEVFETIAADEEAVSPVIATILLVAITVVLAGTIYVWSSSLADVSGKASPRVTALTDVSIDDSDENNWAWKITVNGAQTELATQAVRVNLEWLDSSGEQQFRTVNLTDKYAPEDTCLADSSLIDNSGNSGDSTGNCGVYGRLPSNSNSMVTFKDNIDCTGDNADCTTGFGAGDIIYILMKDPVTGDMLESVLVSVVYVPGGQTATPLMTYTGITQPPRLS